MNQFEKLLEGVEVEWKALGEVATKIVQVFTINGFIMDERLKNLRGGNYWKSLFDRIRDIRSSEKVKYRQVKDLKYPQVKDLLHRKVLDLKYRQVKDLDYHSVRNETLGKKQIMIQYHSVRNETLGKKQITIQLHSVRNAS